MEEIEKSSDNVVLALSANDQKLILDYLEHPREPNPAMLEALKMYSLYVTKNIK
ncbi:toxin-antitoxin system, antitoxin component, ribbon-helix-helix domain protein [Haemophilus sputorum HK 2154]|uniref:type II toxin -antitoxin system TacA 1-like antitoxin n=1 Tax=Haemophilus sputorum TaxID=1078480 RepID=UPI00024898B2|nr:DUF1778 domain-containing protein [Haemophilus sputorum]EJP29772.1 toxin-antitoxin system, antitoxin component, ribbon-helix-helix domain protein [Haemophilus sputorum HK 2154]